MEKNQQITSLISVYRSWFERYHTSGSFSNLFFISIGYIETIISFPVFYLYNIYLAQMQKINQDWRSRSVEIDDL